jgi:hypothetical protein
MKNAKISNNDFQKLSFDNAVDFKIALMTLKIMPRTTNRDVSQKHVDTLKASILKMGVLRPILVVESDGFGEGTQLYMNDAQHLRVAIIQTDSKDLKGFFEIWVTKNASAEEIVLGVGELNTTSSLWTMRQHFNSCLGLANLNPIKYSAYNDLQAKLIETRLDLVGLVEAYGVENDVKHEAFKKSRMVFDEMQGNRILSIYDEAIKMGLNKNGSSFKAIVRHLRMNKNLNIQKFLHKISINPLFNERFSRDRYLSLFASIR